MARRKAPVRIVPRLVLGASFVAVVPAAALTGCSSGLGVAALGFYDASVAACCFDGGVADVGFRDASDASDGARDASDAAKDGASDATNDAAADATNDAADAKGD